MLEGATVSSPLLQPLPEAPPSRPFRPCTQPVRAVKEDISEVLAEAHGREEGGGGEMKDVCVCVCVCVCDRV